MRRGQCQSILGLLDIRDRSTTLTAANGNTIQAGGLHESYATVGASCESIENTLEDPCERKVSRKNISKGVDD